jgi:hypothetical protein
VARADELAAKRALLIAQADYDRMKLTLAAGELRRIVRPPIDMREHPRAHTIAARALRFAIPVLGVTRAGGLVRAFSIALAIYRIVRSLRAG